MTTWSWKKKQQANVVKNITSQQQQQKMAI
jgi:hypothetical protein